VIRVPVATHELLLTIDTGFNGDLLLAASAASALGFASEAEVTTIELGDGTTTAITEGEFEMSWLSQMRKIRLLVSPNWHPVGDDPVGLIGTKFLAPHLLLIDFEARSVEIETQ
jgi:predicted aspartyl protease